ncbi:MAG: hypothetical protein IJ668_06215 [Selenomonadaceae bacterium]|nr:hypothetical protein [Selenomonadaceae bacterium]
MKISPNELLAGDGSRSAGAGQRVASEAGVQVQNPSLTGFAECEGVSRQGHEHRTEELMSTVATEFPR